MPMRLRPSALSVILLLTSAFGAGADIYESYDAGLAAAAVKIVGALAERPDPTVVVPPLRRSDGRLSELGHLLAGDLMIDLINSGGRATVCNRSGIDEILRELDLERKGFTDRENLHRLGEICSADNLLLGTLFKERDGATVRLFLIDTETAETVTGDRFWIPLSEDKRKALDRPVPQGFRDDSLPDSYTEKRDGGPVDSTPDDNLPQSDKAGAFDFTLRSCTFRDHHGVHCHLEIENEQGISDKVQILPSTVLVDNQGTTYTLTSIAASGTEIEAGPGHLPVLVTIPSRVMVTLELVFGDIERQEQKAQILAIYTRDGVAEFRDFYFGRDQLQ